jgi:phytoene dehydrogenase-like protein
MNQQKKNTIVVVGAGIAGLSAALRLSNSGHDVVVFEQNWMVGGCAGTYLRKHHKYESGATTLVGLEDYMPLGMIVRETGLNIQPVRLQIPMQIHFPGKEVLTRHESLEPWIEEAESFFKCKQAGFWKEAYGLADTVWRASTKYLDFPPANLKEALGSAMKFKPAEWQVLQKAFVSTRRWMQKSNLPLQGPFMDFVNAQLLITAQNDAENTNAAFGAAALAYPLFPNYYLPGGVGKLSEAMADLAMKRGVQFYLRTPIQSIRKASKGYVVQAEGHSIHAQQVVSAIPVNNLIELLGERPKGIRDVRTEGQLWSAFQTSFSVNQALPFPALHHQIHLERPIPSLTGNTLFVSFSHPDDRERSPEGNLVVSVSTHINLPSEWNPDKKAEVESDILQVLRDRGFLNAQPDYVHSAALGSWQKWTGRAFGAVGGYPQIKGLLPWKMNTAYSGWPGLWLAGDTVYPGQGIPGAALSGWIAGKRCLK